MDDFLRSSADKIKYNYKFIFKSGEDAEFNIELDRFSLNIIQTGEKYCPEWTKLNRCKCPNCTLNERKNKFCPIAVNLEDIIDYFSIFVSSEPVEVIVTANERTYLKKVTLQQGVSSLIGIYMVTSGCPVMEKLKPMVRFHLPFATMEETMYRAISMFLVSQYFSYRHGGKAEWDLKKLTEAYENVKIVNKSFLKRLKTIDTKDSNLMAVVVLDYFAKIVNFSIDSKMVDDLYYLFEGYI
ncbi:MAG: hypothetical protein JW925_02770 [Syntrophaceae bacterium]|nr:hypothetical protein [Syntrophaceae bacterium]